MFVFVQAVAEQREMYGAAGRMVRLRLLVAVAVAAASSGRKNVANAGTSHQPTHLSVYTHSLF